jgi:hypothetical protein
MLRDIEFTPHLLGPGPPVLDMVGKTSLPGIEVDSGDGLTRLDQRNCNVHCDGRLPRPALLIADNDDAGGWWARTFNQHEIALENLIELSRVDSNIGRDSRNPRKSRGADFGNV